MAGRERNLSGAVGKPRPPTAPTEGHRLGKWIPWEAVVEHRLPVDQGAEVDPLTWRVGCEKRSDINGLVRGILGRAGGRG